LKIANKTIRLIPVKTGFTFLEVMISLSLIALLFSVLFKMQSQTIELATSTQFNIVAPALAQQLIADMEHDLSNWRF